MFDYLHVGSYGPQHGGAGTGVVTFRRDRVTGRLAPALGHCLTDSPTFLAVHPKARVMYAVHEVPSGRITALRLGADGLPVPIGELATPGHGPCHLLVHPDGAHLITAQYHDGTVSVFALDPAGGLARRTQTVRLGPDDDRPARPHTVVPAPDPGAVVVADLGHDALLSCGFSAGRLRVREAIRTSLAPGCGPRKLVFGRAGAGFVVNESDSTVGRLTWRGAGHPMDVHPTTASTTVRPATGNYPAELVHLASRGRLYVSNRGSDTIAVFDTRRGALRVIAETDCGGRWPQHLLVIGDFLYVANQQSHGLAVFRLDRGDGVPAELLQVMDVRSPSSIVRSRCD